MTIATTVRARFFTGFGIETLSVIIEADCIRVWDSVAGHYTVVHSLSPRVQRRIRGSARR